MKFKCPNCEKRTISARDKMLLGITNRHCSYCGQAYMIHYGWFLVLLFAFLIMSWAFDSTVQLLIPLYLLIILKLAILTIVWIFFVPLTRKI